MGYSPWDRKESDMTEQLCTAGWSPVGSLSLPCCVPVTELFWGLDGLMQVTCSPQGLAFKPFIILSIICYLLLNTSKYKSTDLDLFQVLSSHHNFGINGLRF